MHQTAIQHELYRSHSQSFYTKDIVTFASSFALSTLAELGDKTQLAAVTLSARRSPISVFLGAVLAFALVDGLSALLGGDLAALLSMFWSPSARGSSSSASASILS